MNPSVFYGKKGPITRYRYLQDALDDAGTNSCEEVDIVLLPPEGEDNDLSDEDDGGEDDMLDDDFLPDEVPGELEVHVHDDTDSDEVREVHGDRWRKEETVSLGEHNPPSKLPENLILLEGKSPHEIFELFFSEEMLVFITDQTNLYAKRDKNCPSFNVTEDEMRLFIGILLTSGYHKLPRENDYWSTRRSLEAPIFPKTMSRNRFKIIKRFLHISDNSTLSSSKIAKVEPLLDMLRKNCQQFGVFDEFLSVDESMIPYKGLHSARKFIKTKPVRFGFKMWMLCGSTGFPYNFELYCGKDPQRTEPLGSSVVNKMLAPIEEAEKHVVFFDNFF